MIAARAAAYVVGIAAAVSLIFVEVGAESLILAGIVLASVLIAAWSHGVFTREPRPPRAVSSYLERPATPEERAAWSAASPFFDQDDLSRLDRSDGLDTRR